MIKPPFTAKFGQSGVWIEDANGLSIADMSSLIDPMEAFRAAELLVNGTNSYLRRVEHAQCIGKERGGRPPKKLKKSGKESIKKGR